MTHRFRFIGDTQNEGLTWHLAEDEAFHIAKVLRLPVDTEVEVANTRGLSAVGVLSSSSPRSATVTCSASSVIFTPQPTQQITIALGALKPGSLDDILPMLTELGADHLVIFHQHDTAKSRITDKVQDRWQRILQSSVKQCKRPWLPTLSITESLSSMISKTSGSRFVLSPGAPTTLLSALSRTQDSITLTIGGERGLDEKEEADLISAGFIPVSLGSPILRAITASIAATALAAQVRERR